MQTRKFIPCDCFVCCRCVCSTRDWNWNRSDVDDVAGCDSDCDVNQVWYVFWWFNTVLHDLFSHYSLHAIFFSLRILWTENCFIVDDNAPYTLDARFLATKLSSNEAKFIRLIKSSDVLLLIVIRENYFIFNLRINFIISLSSISMPDGSLLLWAYENLRKDSIKNVIFSGDRKKRERGKLKGMEDVGNYVDLAWARSTSNPFYSQSMYLVVSYNRLSQRNEEKKRPKLVHTHQFFAQPKIHGSEWIFLPFNLNECV